MFFKKKDAVQKFQETAEEIKRTRYGRERYQVSLKARAGDHEAAVAMGRYWLGDGPSYDKRMARDYLVGAARAGNKEAQLLYTMSLMNGMNDKGTRFSTWASLLSLDFMSLTGFRNEQNQWMIDEAEIGGHGLRALVCVLDMHYSDGATKIISHQQIEGHAWSGSPPAAATLAWCYWGGHGTTTNYESAYIWFSIAKTLGMNSVDEDIEVLEKMLSKDILPNVQAQARSHFEEILAKLVARQDEEETMTAISAAN